MRFVLFFALVFTVFFFFWVAVFNSISENSVIYQECGGQYCEMSEGTK